MKYKTKCLESSAEGTQYSQFPRPVLPKFWCGQETHLWLRREQGLWEAVEVTKVELDACIGDSQLMHVCGTVPWADVALSRERRHRDCVLQLILGQIVRNPSINISLKSRQMQPFSQLTKAAFLPCPFSCLCQQLGKRMEYIHQH